MAIYAKSFRRFFTFVVPLACVAYFPVVGILGIADPLGSSLLFQVLAPLAGFIFFGATLLLWRFGVRHYTSTGS
jgi:ABC-2 type transport system permease protein